MTLAIRLFATLKEQAGNSRVSLPATTPVTVAELLVLIADHYPDLAPALPTTLVAVNKAFATPDTIIQEGDEIALFPPVSGGSASADPPTFFAITPDPLDLNAIHQFLLQDEIGAIVTFTGSVRGRTDRSGQPAETLYLEYEAYSEMAEDQMAQIAREIWERWPVVKGVAIVQRIGRLDIGDITTFVACAAGHRDQGVFTAARYGIDRLKEIVPVWKKEVGPDKSIWVEGHYRPTADDNK